MSTTGPSPISHLHLGISGNGHHILIKKSQSIKPRVWKRAKVEHIVTILKSIEISLMNNALSGMTSERIHLLLSNTRVLDERSNNKGIVKVGTGEPFPNEKSNTCSLWVDLEKKAGKCSLDRDVELAHSVFGKVLATTGMVLSIFW